MKCPKCQTIMPPHYKKCPVCGYSKLVREEFAPQPKEEEEDTKDNPLIVNGEFNFYEMNDD